MSGVLIGEKHTYNDWGLIWTNAVITAPEPHTAIIDVPFRNGTFDVTSYLSQDVKYKNRTLNLEFVLDDRNMKNWHILYSEIANYLHGKKKKIVLDTDKGFYYFGRCECSIKKDDAVISSYAITVDCDPYKYELVSSLEPWVWDTFIFENSIIRNYKNLKVNGELLLVIPGRRKVVVPIFECSDDLILEYDFKTYNLPIGKSIDYDLTLGEGENILKFIGNGTVSVEYRGGSL